MAKNRAAPPKCLFHVTWIEKDLYTLIEQPVHYRSCCVCVCVLKLMVIILGRQ